MLDIVIDVSHWNTVTDFPSIQASGIVGLIHKATQGVAYSDPLYAERRRMALDAGLLWGAYHFGEGGDVQGQAAHFLDTVQPTPTDLLMLDWEPCEGVPLMSLVEAVTWTQTVALLTGRWPGLYAGQSFLTDQMDAYPVALLGECWLMIARYSSELPVVPLPWTTWTFWQYTENGTVPGIEGPCDREQFNGSLEQLFRLWGVDTARTLLV